ncbi:MAG: hypothetical protein AAGA89_08685 [Pseudomonadota bacterium]
MIRLRQALIALGTGLSFAAPVTAQAVPDLYEAYCGQSAHHQLEEDLDRYDQGGAGAGVFGVVWRIASINNPDRASYYSDRYGDDPDYPQAPNCTTRFTQIERDATTALQAYIGYGFDVDPIRVGPIVEGRSGDPVNRIFLTKVDPPPYAEALSPCQEGGDFLANRLTQIRMNAEQMDAMPGLMVRIAVMHEIFHAVQNSNGLFKQGNPGRCALPKWNYEGTADAMALSFGPGPHAPYREGVDGRYARKVYGMRDYSNDLRVAYDEVRSSTGSPPTPEYSTSSMWTHLSDHYFGGKWNFLANWYAIDYDFDPGHLPWLVDNFEAESNVKFYLAYPNFLTEYAMWGGSKFSHLNAEAWRKKAFHWGDDEAQVPGCKTVELDKSAPKASVSLYPTFHQLSGRCLKVKVSGLSAGEIAQVKIMAYHNETDALDNLHLGTAQLSDVVLSLRQSFNCFQAGKALRRQPACLQKPFMGEIPEPLPNENPNAPAHSYAKTWSSMKQRAEDDSLENIYVITHTPITPRDEIDRFQRFKGYRLDVAIDYSGHETSDSGKARKSKGRAGMMDNDPVPMDGTDSAGPAGSILGDAMFAHVGIEIPDFDAEAGGIAMLTLTAMHEVLQYNEIVLTEGEQFLVMLEEPIRFGQTGPYAGMLVGMPSRENTNPQQLKLNWPPETPARVMVERYDSGALVIAVQGGFCRFSDINPETEQCLNPAQFRGRLMRPFGWAYAPGNRFNPISTPGMELYADALARNMARRLGGRLDALGPLAAPDGNPPSSGDAPQTVALPGCDCSCEYYQSLLSVSDGLNRGERPPDNIEEQMQSMQSCMPTCGQSWGQCEPR